MNASFSPWFTALVDPLTDLVRTVLLFLPTLFSGLLALVIFLIVAGTLAVLVEKLFGFLHVDAFLRKLGLEPYVERAGLQLNSGVFFGKFAYWFVMVAGALAVSEIFGLVAFAAFLQGILGSIQNFVAALLIVLLAALVADFLRGVVSASVMGLQAHSAKFIGLVTWWVVIVFGFMTALQQVNVDVSFFRDIILAVVFAFALATGIAFGLGGKEYAASLLERFRRQVEHRE